MSTKGAGSGSAKNYYGDIAGVACAGPVDELVSVIIDGKTVWPTVRGWADDIVDLPAISIERKNGKGYITFAAPHKLHHQQRFVSSGFPAPPDGDSFNYAEGFEASITNNNDYRIQFVNDGSDFGPIDVTSGTITKVVTYNLNDLVRSAGGIWKCILGHDGDPSTAPPNPTYWESYSVLRAGNVNPYPLTIEGFGQAYFYWGTDDQELRPDSFLMVNGHPPYRRQAFLEFERFLFGTERQGPPNIEVVVRRKPQQTVIDGDSAELDDGQANPLAVAADLHSDEVFGIGRPAAKLDAASWQDTADALQAIPASTYISPILDRQDSMRAFLAALLAYYDGWLRFDADSIVAGRFLHNTAPPAFDATTTIDYNDLVEEIEFDAGGFADTANETVVRFADRARAYKDAGQLYVSGYNRQVVGEPRRATISRPWVTRESQALLQAAEYGKINAQPKISGSLVCRAEKAAAIQPGTVFRLTHDALQFSVVCRCTEKTLAAPPAGRATLRFESERGVAPIPYAPTVAAGGGTGLAHAERITYYQLFQPPPSLAGSQDFRVIVLAARKSALSLGLRPWLKVDDADLFYQLGEQRGFAVNATLTQDYPAPQQLATEERSRDSNVATLTITAHGYATGMRVSIAGLGDPDYNIADVEITVVDANHFSYTSIGADENDPIADTDGVVTPLADDESETLQIDPQEFTVQSDLERISETQTADAINDNALLVWLTDGTDFEIATLKEIRLDSGVYKLKVRRGRFNTAIQSWAAGATCWIGYRSQLVAYGHEKFAEYAQAATPAVFRLQSFSATEDADLADSDVCPNVEFTFADPYAPVGTFVVEEVDPDGTGYDAINFDNLYNSEDDTPPARFRLAFSITDANADLIEGRLVARQGTQELTLWAQSFSPTGEMVRTIGFVLPEGQWQVVLVARDQSGRVREFELEDIIQVQTSTNQGTQVQTPQADPTTGDQPSHFSVTLTCATAGATIKYSLVAYGNPPGAYSNYTGTPVPVSVYTNSKKTLWVYAIKGGLTDSAVVRFDYWLQSNL